MPAIEISFDEFELKLILFPVWRTRFAYIANCH